MAEKKEGSGSSPESKVAKEDALSEAVVTSAFVTRGSDFGLTSERGPLAPGDEVGNFVPSPTGPVPVSALTNDPAKAQQIRQAREERLQRELGATANEPLSEEQINNLPAAELRAVAAHRGYNLGGTRTISRSSFRSQQDKDENLEEEGTRAKRLRPSFDQNNRRRRRPSR